MHDPMTLCFQIKFPWGRKIGNHFYFESFIDIWHVDPETDGSDDSCGYSFVKQTKEEIEKIEKLADSEFNSMIGCFGHQLDRLEAIYAVWVIVKRFNERKYPKITHKEMLYILSLAYNPVDNLYYAVKELNKTHFNHIYAENRTMKKLKIESRFDLKPEQVEYNEEEKKLINEGKEKLRKLFYLINRCYLTYHRPWYKKPKWHIHHWRINIVVLQKLKRFLFERCCICWDGYSYGYSPIADWNGTKTWHFECDDKIDVKNDS